MEPQTLIEAATAAHNEYFFKSHSKLIKDIVNKSKEEITMSEQEVKSLETKIIDKSSFLSDDMKLHIAGYEDRFSKYIGDLLADELKIMIDDRIKKLGFKK